MDVSLPGLPAGVNMAKVHRSPLAVLLLAAACYVLSFAPGFVAPTEVAHTAAEAVVGAAATGLAPLNEASSMLTADLSPLENPNITFVVLLSMFSMSIALVVWGRNGF
ncbi:hypothetical protein AK812_SmicGene28226 [Symbiodinium microadriaticum]|uniref:Cytochrome b6-f complex subunit PetN n=1 Tax=Symbiodinium microadriaticum TaxID=2951 RepID=A0A1Q9D4X9_SYMMI|nr:hypothetical protein AK812_SmicGene28226 [Symbiodinium microadriaticum]